MKFNFFNRNKRPTDAEKEIVTKASTEADPTTYTSLPVGELKEVGRADIELHNYAIVEDASGTRYVDMSEKFAKPGATEQAVAAMLKGIINVSDVVTVSDEQGTKYYSKIVELDKTPNTTLQEMNADVALVETIFNDPDRSIAFGTQEDHNLVRDEKRMKVAYFDFGGVKSHFWREGYINQKRAIGALDSVGLAYLEDKLHTLKDRLSGEQGEAFLRSILERSGETIPNMFSFFPMQRTSEDPFVVLHGTIIDRIQQMLVYVDERKNVRKVA